MMIVPLCHIIQQKDGTLSWIFTIVKWGQFIKGELNGEMKTSGLFEELLFQWELGSEMKTILIGWC